MDKLGLRRLAFLDFPGKLALGGAALLDFKPDHPQPPPGKTVHRVQAECDGQQFLVALAQHP